MERRDQVEEQVPPTPPKCPRIVSQTLPRRPARARLKRSKIITRARVCPPMQLVHPAVVPCLCQEAPVPLAPAPVADDRPPRVPQVIPPLLLGHVEVPSLALFGSVLPLPPVGRSRDDGGMPRPIIPRRATVMPPVFFATACSERVIAALGLTNTVLPPRPEPPPCVVVPPLYGLHLEDMVEATSLGCPSPHETEVLRTACNDIPRAILPIDVQPPPKPRRAAIAVPRVCQPKRVTVFSGGLEGDSLISADEDALANCCKSPALGWTPAIQEAIHDFPPETTRPSSPPIAAPVVPMVAMPVPNPRARSGRTMFKDEYPIITRGIEETACRALQSLGALPRLVTEAPPIIRREAVAESHLQDIADICLSAWAPNAACDSQSHVIGTSRISRPRSTDFDDTEQPLWRDGENESQKTPDLRSPAPIWRDSEHLRRKSTSISLPPPSSELVRKLGEVFVARSTDSLLQHVTDPRPPAGSLALAGLMLRRKRALHAPPTIDERSNGENTQAPFPRQDDNSIAAQGGGVGKVVWKDIAAATPVRQVGEKSRTILHGAGFDHLLKEAKLMSLEEGVFAINGRQGSEYLGHPLKEGIGVAPFPPPRYGQGKARPREQRNGRKKTTSRGVNKGVRAKSAKFDGVMFSSSAPGEAYRRDTSERWRSHRHHIRRSASVLTEETPPNTPPVAVWESMALAADPPPTPKMIYSRPPSGIAVKTARRPVSTDVGQPQRAQRTNIVMADPTRTARPDCRAPAFDASCRVRIRREQRHDPGYSSDEYGANRGDMDEMWSFPSLDCQAPGRRESVDDPRNNRKQRGGKSG